MQHVVLSSRAQVLYVNRVHRLVQELQMHDALGVDRILQYAVHAGEVQRCECSRCRLPGQCAEPLLLLASPFG